MCVVDKHSYILNFNGRVHRSSVKNIQFVSDDMRKINDVFIIILRGRVNNWLTIGQSLYEGAVKPRVFLVLDSWELSSSGRGQAWVGLDCHDVKVM